MNYESHVITPVKADRLKYHLVNTNYPAALTDYLIEGFTKGFRIGVDSVHISKKHEGSKISVHLTDAMSDIISSEVTAGRMAGPFIVQPFDNFNISPISLREKSTKGKFRMIHNLSYPHNDESINANVDCDMKTVQYSNIREAIRILSKMPKGAYSAKTDIEHAFKLIPIHISDQPRLGLKFQGQFYYDRTLPMGLSSACKIFEAFASALEHIFKHYAHNAETLHYLDDFIFFGIDENTCKSYVQLFQHICTDIGVPLSHEKTTAPATQTVFLGILLDSANQYAMLPRDKITRYTSDINTMRVKRTSKKRDLQSIIGKLSFASSVVPGRAFLRRLIDLLCTAKKPDHFISLSSECKLDLLTWCVFLKSYNGITFFRSLNYLDASFLNMQSDASPLGFGATFEKHWLQCAYPADWQSKDISILELYPIYVLISMFGERLRNRSIIFNCDNMAVCHIIMKLSAKNKPIMQIVRKLVLVLIKFNINLRSNHIPGITNTLCDKLSRFQDVSKLVRDMDPEQSKLPEWLLPQNFVGN